MQIELPGKQKPYLMAHRGNSAVCPENTLAAFQHAIEDGADIIETDLHLTADGTLVCIHDETVDRTTDGSGAVADMTLHELKQLQAHNGKTGFADAQIPTLEEVLELIAGKCAVALELKTDQFLDPDICQRLVQTLDQAKMRFRTVVISFSLQRVQAVQTIAPDIPIGFITMDQSSPLPDVQLLGPVWQILQKNPHYVAIAHQRGQIVCPLDEAPDSRLELYQQLGCDVIMSNDPAATAQAMQATGLR